MDVLFSDNKRSRMFFRRRIEKTLDKKISGTVMRIFKKLPMLSSNCFKPKHQTCFFDCRNIYRVLASRSLLSFKFF